MRWRADLIHSGLLASAMLPVAASIGPLAAAAPPRPGAYPLACWYEGAGSEMETADACAAATVDGVVLAPQVQAALAYRDGLASFAVGGIGWFHRRRNGVTVRMMTFDNGPDYFVEGLARAIVSGKLAYVDRQLRVRIRTTYDWGDRFEHGRAEVCVGCAVQLLDGGEHSIMVGGRWGVIDRRGREVVPVTRAAGDLPGRRR